jgi:hypothetical protein
MMRAVSKALGERLKLFAVTRICLINWHAVAAIFTMPMSGGDDASLRLRRKRNILLILPML